MMHLHLFSNTPGMIMFVVAFGAALGIGQLLGISKEGLLMIIASPPLIAADIIYRAKSANKRWFHPDDGGMVLFLPIWMWGIWWLILGIAYSIAS
jgi:hypothetical protein